MGAWMRGKRARLGALAVTCAAMVALGVTLGLTQRDDAPDATVTTATATMTATAAKTTTAPAVALPANPSTCTARTLGVSRASNPGLAADCDALLAIGSTLRVSGWSAGSALRHWRGVTLGGTPQRVTGLDLSDNSFTGSIPTQLGRLTALTSLALSSGNAFTGCIPGPLWAAETHDLAALGRPTCTDGSIGNEGTIKFGAAIGPGTYRIPFEDGAGVDKGLVFTVPMGLRIQAQGVSVGGSCWETCPPPGVMFDGGDGTDGGFLICLDLDTGAECARGYPITRVAGEAVDDAGRPVRTRDADRADRARRVAKYDSLIDQLVASAHIEAAP